MDSKSLMAVRLDLWTVTFRETVGLPLTHNKLSLFAETSSQEQVTLGVPSISILSRHPSF